MKEARQKLAMEGPQETDHPKPQNLEAYLRDSILGDDLRNYDEKIEKLTQEVENTRQSISEVESRLLKEISDLKELYGNIPDNIVQRVDNRIDELISRTENDLEKLSELVNEFATGFQAQIDGVQAETQTLQNNNNSNRQSLADALIAIGTQLKNEQ